MFLSAFSPRSTNVSFDPVANLAVGVFRQTNPARLGDALEPRGDVDAIAHEIAVRLLDHVAEMDADAQFDAPSDRDARVALDHRVLNFNRAAHGVDHAAELDDEPVAGALEDAAVWTAIVGSTRSLRSARSRASVRSCPRPRAG